MDDFEKAKDKIMMGAERQSMVMTEEEKKLTAYHEAGHAIVGRLVPEHDPVYKVSIIPRGRALGVTMFLPEGDRYSISKQRLESQISSLFGGRIAEELIFGAEPVTTGAPNDIERATEIARNMVTKWGLSDRLGPLTYSEDEGEVFLGRSVTQHKNVSDETAHVIDEEIRIIIDRNYRRSEQLLREHLDKLHAMADALIKYETIDAEQIDDIMAGRAAARAGGFEHRCQEPPATGSPVNLDKDVGRVKSRSAGRPSSTERRTLTLAPLLPVQRKRGFYWSFSAMLMNCAGKLLDLTPAGGHGGVERHPRFLLRRRALPASLDAALRRAEAMVAEGAAIIDVGGESTRPGAPPVSVQEELDRVLPVIDGSRASCRSRSRWTPASREVMRAAARAGAGLINDVRALRLPGALEAAAASGLPVCLMHMQGEPATMQQEPRYGDVVAEVRAFLAGTGAGLRGGGHSPRTDPGGSRFRFRQDPGA